MKIIVLSLLAIMLFINCSSDDSSQEQQCSNELTVELEPPTEVTQTGARLIGVITPPSCDMVITSQPCPLLVPLIEYGRREWVGPILGDYLQPLITANVESLILGGSAKTVAF